MEPGSSLQSLLQSLRHYPLPDNLSIRTATMSSTSLPSFPTLNLPTNTPTQTTTTMESLNLDYMPGITDATMDDTSMAASLTTESRGSTTMPPPSRSMDPGYIPPLAYQPPLAYPPVGPAPYPGNGPTGPYAHGPNLQLPNTAYPRIESVSDLVLPDSLNFEYSPELNAVLHTGKCTDCVQFGMHIIRPGSRAKFLRATTAHSESSLIPLRAEIAKLISEAQITAKTLNELKDALQASQKNAASLQEQRDKFRQDYDELLMEHRTQSQRVADLEQQIYAASHRRPHSPTRGSRYRSPTRSGTRPSTPYERPATRRTVNLTSKHTHTPTPTLLEPTDEGDIVMAAVPTSIKPAAMHETQPRHHNRRPCPASNYRWVTDKNVDMIGLPKTRAGTYFLPNRIGFGWYQLENGATSIDEVYRRIDLLFRNRRAEIWRAAARSAFEFRRLISPLPEVMQYFIKLDSLRKDVWTIIDDSVAGGANLSTISPGCRLHADGYAGLYTPDVQLWAVIHAATDVDPTKLTNRTGRTSTAADLKKMFKDALCSDNYFGISPVELATGEYRLPRLAHYDGALDMDSIVGWLRDTIGMSPYMVHAHFRPFLRRSHEATPGERHQVFSPHRLSLRVSSTYGR